MGIEPKADCLEATECTSFLLSPLEHNRGYFLDGFELSIPENVGIGPESDARICVPQLLLNDLRSCAHVE
jgi:hypothetical protein